MQRPPRGTRPEPRDVADLRSLAERQPELAPAAGLQIDLLDAERRVRSRIATAGIDRSPEALGALLSSGRPLADFDEIPIEWTEARLLFRQVTDVLKRHEAIDAAQASRLHEIGRGAELPALARAWYAGKRNHGPLQAVEMLEEVIAWALRPFLVRVAEVLQQKTAFDAWGRGHCPVCGGKPEFGHITTGGERHLICGRCQARWPFDPIACPFCGESRKDRITSLATPDGTYRVAACQTCRRYVKMLDGRHANRPVMLALDGITTLPLDAVVMQRGFSNSE